jgi:hypothetical protein
VIAFPRATVPVPDAVADLAGRQLPPHVRDAVTEASLCGRLLTGRTLATVPASVRVEPATRLHERLARATKTLAAHNPGLVARWGNLPGLTRKEG